MLVVLVLLAHDELVGVLGVLAALLQDERVLLGVQPGVDGVVAVDDRGLGVRHRLVDLGAVDRGELQLLGVGGHVGVAGQLGGLIQLDEPGLGQELEATCRVGRVVVEDDRAALLDVLDVLVALGGVDTHGLDVNVGDGDEVVALLLVLLSQEVGGLVEVGGQRAVLQRGVGRLVVVDLLDVQLDAGALGEVVLDPLEDLDVGLGGGADGDRGGIAVDLDALDLALTGLGAGGQGEGGGGGQATGDDGAPGDGGGHGGSFRGAGRPPVTGERKVLNSAGADGAAARFWAAQRTYPAGDRLSGGSPAG